MNEIISHEALLSRIKELESLEDESRICLEILDQIPAFICLREKDYSTRYSNSYFNQHFGKSDEHNPCYSRLFGRDKPCRNCSAQRIFEAKRSRLKSKDRAIDGRTYRVFDYPIKDSDGTPLVLKMGFDITDKVLAEERLAASHTQLLTILDNMDAVVHVTNIETYEILYMNRYAKGLFGDAVGKVCWEVLQINKKGPCESCRKDKIIDEKGEPSGLHRWESKNRRTRRYYQTLEKAIRWDNGEVVRLEIAVDITDRKKKEEKVLHAATHDPLTNVPNRSLFYDRLSMASASARRGRKIIGILLIDLDGYKKVNDDYGHDVGDVVLKMVAERFLSCIRQTDTLARMGGDEFAIILNPLKHRDEARVIAKKINRMLRATFPIRGHDIKIGASIGISIDPSGEMDHDDLLMQADRAMYTAKRRGKSGYGYFDEKRLKIRE